MGLSNLKQSINFLCTTSHLLTTDYRVRMKCVRPNLKSWNWPFNKWSKIIFTSHHQTKEASRYNQEAVIINSRKTKIIHEGCVGKAIQWRTKGDTNLRAILTKTSILETRAIFLGHKFDKNAKVSRWKVCVEMQVLRFSNIYSNLTKKIEAKATVQKS